MVMVIAYYYLFVRHVPTIYKIVHQLNIRD